MHDRYCKCPVCVRSHLSAPALKAMVGMILLTAAGLYVGYWLWAWLHR
jgi:hypothetical protein